MSHTAEHARRSVQGHTGTLRYGRKLIPFHFWSHTDEATPVHTVIFLGSAQVGKIPKWVAEAAPAGVAVVDGLPHWEAHPSASDLGKLAHEYTVAAFQTVLKHFKISAATIVGVSQAGPGVVWAARSLPEQVQNVALVAPLGLTAHVFGSSPEVRLKKLKRRTLRTYIQFSQTPLHDPRILYMQLMLFRALSLEKRWDAADNKYAAGLSYDLLEDCRAVAGERQRRGNSFIIFLAEKDKIFPPHEVQASLKRGAIKHVKTIVLPVISHPSLASRSNRRALVQIVNYIRQAELQ